MAKKQNTQKKNDKNLSQKQAPPQIKHEIAKQNKSKPNQSSCEEHKSRGKYQIKLNNEKRGQIWQLKTEGKSIPEIAETTNVNVKTIRSQPNQYRKNRYPSIQQRVEELLRQSGKDQGDAKSIYQEINLILKYHRDPLLNQIIKNLEVKFDYQRDRTYIRNLSKTIEIKVSKYNQNQQSQMSQINSQNIPTKNSNVLSELSNEGNIQDQDNQGEQQSYQTQNSLESQDQDSKQFWYKCSFGKLVSQYEE